jgi:NAD(P)-dependent dehydrogenase (short-subunit alcohol dehydrogenase family)
MGPIDATHLLRRGLLDGACMLLAGASSAGEERESLGDAVHATCAALGAQVTRCAPPLDASHEEQEAACEAAVLGALAQIPRIDMLVVDAAAIYELAQAAGSDAQLAACLQATWAATRAVFTGAFLPEERAGRILYLAPAAGAGEHAEPVLAGLENLARTLSIEWARHGVTAVTVAAGRASTPEEIATVTAYLASPAGAYFSGCLLDLRGPGARS